MFKVKKLKAEIERLKDDLFLEKQITHNLKMSVMRDDAYSKSLKDEITQLKTKYIEEVQKNVALADIVVSLREKLDDAERCGYCE